MSPIELSWTAKKDVCVFEGHIISKMVLAPGGEFVRTQRRTCLRRSVEILDIITDHLKKGNFRSIILTPNDVRKRGGLPFFF